MTYPFPRMLMVAMPLGPALERAVLRGLYRAASGTGVLVTPSEWIPITHDSKEVVSVFRRTAPPQFASVPPIHVGGDFTKATINAWIDDEATGRLAAQHLVSSGATSLAYCGNDIYTSSKRREAGVRAVAQSRGLEYHRMVRSEAEQGFDPGADREVVADGLRRLPHGAGVVTFTAIVAKTVIGLASELALAVPGSLYVVSCEDDPLINDLSAPGFSAVQHPGEDIGRLAFELACRSWRGEMCPSVSLLQPIQVLARYSSRTVGNQDPLIVRALSRIDSHAAKGIRVTDLAQDLGCSPRVLGERFSAAGLGRPSEHLLRTRIEHAKRLLRETDLAIAQVSVATGYQSSTRFTNTFRDQTGVSPRVYRQRNQRDIQKRRGEIEG